MAAKISVRAAVATLQLATIQLLEAAGVTDINELNDLSVNIHFRDSRIDIAKLTPEGEHLEQWICGFSIDPHDLSAFGTLVLLPGMDRRTH
jgi:hypothetical protein